MHDPTAKIKLAARILVVEHDHAAAAEMCSQLGSLNYQICGCVDAGAAAVDAAQALRPDLVVINAVLPGEISGIQAAEEIYRRQGTPLLFLSAYSDPDTVGRALAAQPYGYLTKPFDIRELYAQIEVALAKGRADQQARDALQWYSATLRGVADSVIVTDAAAGVRYLNPAAEKLLGWNLADAEGQDIDVVLHLQDAAGLVLASPLRSMMAEGAPALMPGCMYVRPRQGEPCMVEDSAAPIYGAHGDLLGSVMVLRDIRQRAAAEQQLRRSEERFRNAFDLAPGGMALTGPDGRFIRVNSALCQLLRADAQQLAGRRLDDFAAAPSTAAPHLEALRDGQATTEFEQRLRVGAADVWVLVSVSTLRPEDGGGQLFQLNDITQRKRAERKLARLAHFDGPTGLPNRTAISKELERQIALARRRAQRLAVMFIDLDYFKHVNDSLGHEAGDQLLRVISKRLRNAVRESDTVGRMGGDEFVVLLPEVTDLSDILRVAAKMQAECLKPALVRGRELRVGISLGVSLYPDDAEDARTLLRYADSAMYQAKAEGRGNIQFYRRAMTRGIDQRLRMGADLRRALDCGEFELHFQPIVALDSLRPRSVEALLRWRHPQLGLLGPDSFLPVIEDIGLAGALGAWVCRTACHTALAWLHAAAEPLQLAINLSPSQFRDRMLVANIGEALTTSGLPPQQLCLEITEHVLLEDTQHNREVLGQLKALGVKIAIDDFGTGYSSLSYLGRYGADELKIDRSLTEDVCEKTEHAAIVRAAIAMARSLRLTVITEGVENAQQHELLRALGADWGQGYWYLAPCPAEAFLAWLTQQAGVA